MDAASKAGLFRPWYYEIKNFDSKFRSKAFLLPHLRVGAGLVTVFVSSFFAAHLADALAIVVAYGPRAYFHEGLRIYDWKHGILSDGSHLSFVGGLVQVPSTLVLWVALIFATDFCSMMIQHIVRRTSPWLESAFCFFGAAGLLLFAASLYHQSGWGLHPVPLSALIGGTVLIWKGFARVFRGSPKTQA